MTRMFLALISLAVFPAGGISQTSGFSDFVFDLVDLEKLARVDYTPAKMVSSYDRTGANDDGFNPARLEGVTYTIADLKGPGVIRRMWTARPRGKLHIYLDGDPKPIVSVSAHDFFAGRKHPFPRPIVGPMGRGYYSYFPIPFAKSIKIQLTPHEGEDPASPYGGYHQVSYQQLDSGTPIHSLRLPLSATEKASLAKVLDLWRNPGRDPKEVSTDQVTIEDRVEIGFTGRAILADLRGAGVMDRLQLKIEPASSDLLRDVLIKMQWDDLKSESVDSPLGDFFGNGFSFVPYRSLPTGLTEEGFYSYFSMPFASRAKISLVNQSRDTAITVAYRLTYHKTSGMPANVGHFHAKWRRQEAVAVDMHRKNQSAVHNYTFLDVRGSGRYVGVNLNLFNRYFYWWGEGDPMIFIDEDTWSPSLHGTGTEDYFNDAWGFHDTIELDSLDSVDSVDSVSTGLDKDARQQNVNPTSGVLIPGIGAGQYWGPNVVFIFHIADSIPFRERALVTVEHGSENEMTNDYASTAYWYALPGAKDFFTMRPAKERQVPSPEEWPRLRETSLQAFGTETRQELSDVAAEVEDRPTDAVLHRPRVRLLRRVLRNSELLGLSPALAGRIQRQWSAARRQPMEERWPILDQILLELGNPGHSGPNPENR